MIVLDPLSAALADRYDLERELGRGGMATVFLARDRKHDRLVAIKVLNPELGAMLGAERFLAEIKVTATLQHPNLLPLFDSGEVNGLLYYVMPYLEGETLRARLLREQQLSIDDAVRIATGIAHALSYAHARNVVHRDLKPENILLQHGQPVVLDFGIALAMRNAGGTRMTQTGVSIGTPQYMSPEQAAGEKQIDARTDIYALGALLYEMLAGETPHAGPTAQVVIAKVMSGDAMPVTRMRPSVPPAIANATHKALSRLPADRFASADEFIRALQITTVAVAPDVNASNAGAIDSGARASRSSRAYAAVAVAALVVAGAAIAWSLTRTPSASNPAVRFVLETPASEALAPSSTSFTIAVAPDGSEIVYRGVSTDGVMLYRRRLNELSATPVPGSLGANSFFYSPSGDELLVYKDNGQTLLPLHGGEPTAISSFAASPGPWDDAASRAYVDAAGIWQVPARGGTPKRVVAADSTSGYLFAHVLPGGKALLTTRGDRRNPLNPFDLVAIALPDGKVVPLGLRGGDARYIGNGFLMYGDAAGVLLAVPFDPSSLTVNGTPEPLVRDVSGEPPTRWAVSKTGVLTYLERRRPRFVVTADQRGIERPLYSAPISVAHLRVSPKGDRIAYEAEGANGGSDIFVYSRSTKVAESVTRDGHSRSPEWSADGARLYWIFEDSVRTTNSSGTRFLGRASQMMSQPLDRSAPPTRVTTPPGLLHTFSLSPDGKHIAISVGLPASHQLVLSTVNSAEAVATIGDGQHDIVQSIFSPDGKWLAYTGNESQRYEVFLVSVAQPSSPLPVSTNGGNSPLWSPKGTTLYYSSATHLLSVALAFTPRPSVRGIDTLFVNGYRTGARDREIDIDPVTNEFVARSTGGQAGERIVVVTGLFDELRKRFPK